jgi:hypothetical protein
MNAQVNATHSLLTKPQRLRQRRKRARNCVDSQIGLLPANKGTNDGDNEKRTMPWIAC